MKKIVFIESNTTGTGKIFVNKAIEKGYEVIFISADPARYGFLSDLMVLPVKLDTSHPADILDYLKTLNGIEAVFSSSEYFIELASHIAQELKLPGNAPNAIAACRDKALLCHHLLEAGIHTPKSVLVTSIEDAHHLLNDVQFPVVIKPASGSGSVGVKRCDTNEEYLTHMTALLAASTNERGQTLPSRILVQEYISGEEYSVEIIGLDDRYEILGITQKYLGKEPFFLEIGHDFPAIVTEELKHAIATASINALKTMGFIFGAAHIELRVYRHQVYIIEINPRLAGGMIPGLIKAALNIDVLDLLLDLHCGKPISIEATMNQYASIRFVIPKQEGMIKDIKLSQDISLMPNIALFTLTKASGKMATQYGDYRDRIGFIIATGKNIDVVRQSVDNALKAINIEIDAIPLASHQDTGRLHKTLQSEALAVINQAQTDQGLLNELRWLTMINEAHLLMLMKQKVISVETGSKILAEIKIIKDDHYAIFKNKPAPRGTYLLYENILIEKLGIDVGGVIHTGRSRNDINATIFKLSTRELVKHSYELIWKLRQTILNQAEAYRLELMPIYSQFQPALPGTYSFYLLAIAEALARDQAAFKQHYFQLAECPLGAGAGCGTSFPISQAETAAYLGFTHVSANALDAVASRDLALRLLSSLSILGTTLSRIAQDFQLWTTQEFAFFELPDELSGGSSMMPQKKNPYLLEKIKGKSVQPMGLLVASMAAMQKTLYCNSVEVGTEALIDFSKSFQSIDAALTLLNLIIEKATPNEAHLTRSNENGITMAVCVSERLVKEGLPFREAHHKVGEAISKALKENASPIAAIYALLKETPNANERWSDTFQFGGGCSEASTHKHLQNAWQQLKQDGIWMQEIIAFWQKSTMLRDQAIHGYLINNKVIT